MLKRNKIFRNIPISLILITITLLMIGCSPKIYNLSMGTTPQGLARSIPFFKTIGVEQFSCDSEESSQALSDAKLGGGQLYRLL